MDKQTKIDAAKRLINDEGIMALLTEYLLDVEEKLTPAAIASMKNEQVGELYRAEITAESKIRNRFGRIKNLANSGGKANPAAKA